MNDLHEQQELLRMIRGGELRPERSREYWSDDERGQLETLYNSGTGISKIALELQRSEQAVVQQLLVMGLMTSSRGSRVKVEREPHCLCRECRVNKNCTNCGTRKENVDA